jgi:hypothetical protein
MVITSGCMYAMADRNFKTSSLAALPLASFNIHNKVPSPKTSTAGYPELILNCINNVKEIQKIK